MFLCALIRASGYLDLRSMYVSMRPALPGCARELSCSAPSSGGTGSPENLQAESTHTSGPGHHAQWALSSPWPVLSPVRTSHGAPGAEGSCWLPTQSRCLAEPLHTSQGCCQPVVVTASNGAVPRVRVALTERPETLPGQEVLSPLLS